MSLEIWRRRADNFVIRDWMLVVRECKNGWKLVRWMVNYDGVANFGRRPMFDSGVILLEVVLFDFNGDLYGQRIDVAFISWIREEAAFSSVDELVRAMHDDAARAREALQLAGNRFPPI